MVGYASLEVVFKDFQFPVMGFWSWMMYGKNGTVPRWLGVSWHVLIGLVAIYFAFRK